jgi:hypothetical protein
MVALAVSLIEAEIPGLIDMDSTARAQAVEEYNEGLDANVRLACVCGAVVCVSQAGAIMALMRWSC